MKVVVIGLDGAVPNLLFGYEGLMTIRFLVESGCYGELEGILPPTSIPGWLSFATSQDPGSLGLYGSRNRQDRSYSPMRTVSPDSAQTEAIWDQVEAAGGRAILVGVPPSYPPRPVNGICVGCYLTPDPSKVTFTHPASLREEIARVVGTYQVDVKGRQAAERNQLREEILAMSRRQFKVVRHLMQHHDWDYFQFVDIGLDRIQRRFWQFHDPEHAHYEPDNPHREVIRDYYAHLDAELAKVLELLVDDTVLMIVADRAARRLDGAFYFNEWLVKEGLLALNAYPQELASFDRLDVNWKKTVAWSDGGEVGQVFLNVKGREPHGTVDASDYEMWRDEIKSRLEALVDETGESIGAFVSKPEETYRSVNKVAPDLIVHFGRRRWRVAGKVGYSKLFSQELDIEGGGCTYGPTGSFVLVAANNPLYGEVKGAHLLDMAPTLLELAGHDVPASMQGRSLVADQAMTAAPGTGLSSEDEEILRERLSGLGYIG